jgi:hypothetical protein
MEADKLMQQSEKLKVEKKQVEADSEKQKAEQLQQKLKAEKDAQQQKGTAQTSGKREITRTVDDGNTVINSSLSYSNGYNYTYPKEAYKPYAPGKNQYILTGIQTDGAGVNKDIDIKELTNNVIADLIEAKVITNAASLSYKVTNESLIVNGKVQPEALHQQLKEKYIQSADWKLLYNWKN